MILNRIRTGKKGTFGLITLLSGRVIHTLELEYKDNKPNVSCIPVGKYQCQLTNSPKFGKVYQVNNVPNRTHILIHTGNWIKDIQGCILVGMSSDDSRLYDSKKALKLFMSELGNKPFELEITRDY